MGNLINAAITCVIAFTTSFIATWVLGFEDVVEENESDKIVELSK